MATKEQQDELIIAEYFLNSEIKDTPKIKVNINLRRDEMFGDYDTPTDDEIKEFQSSGQGKMFMSLFTPTQDLIPIEIDSIFDRLYRRTAAKIRYQYKKGNVDKIIFGMRVDELVDFMEE